MAHKAFVVCRRIENDNSTREPAKLASQYLAAMEMHGKGLGAKADARRRADATFRAVATAVDDTGKLPPARRVRHKVDDPALDLRAAWLRHMRHHGAGIRSNANAGIHLLVGVSPEWLDETGDRHKLGNKRAGPLFREVVRWAESELGGVFAVRMDYDEKNVGTLDVFCAPIREQGRKGSRRKFASVTAALKELGRKHRRMKSYAALQDSWTEWAQRTLDPKLERGDPVEETQRKHLEPEDYAAAAQEIAARGGAELKRQLDELRREQRRMSRQRALDARRKRATAKALREVAAIQKHERGDRWAAEAGRLLDDVEASLDGDDAATERLVKRYAAGGAYSRGKAHSPPAQHSR